MHTLCARRSRGFTLVELVTVMAITAIVGAAVAVFIRLPLQGYQDAQRRADITDAADTAFTRIKRDLQSALPNSVRVTNVGAVFYLEFLQTRTGGRYRASAASPAVPTNPATTCPDTNGDTFADEDVMTFGVADTCFRSLGDIPNLATIVPGSDFLVIYNLGPGFPSADAYASGAVTGGNKSLITAAIASVGSENRITFQANNFALDSPGKRFQVISGAVTFVCDPGAGTLRRVAGYAITPGQPTPAGGDLLAQNITACTFTYDQNVINQRAGVVSMWVGFADQAGGAAVNLFQQVQVSNLP